MLKRLLPVLGVGAPEAIEIPAAPVVVPELARPAPESSGDDLPPWDQLVAVCSCGKSARACVYAFESSERMRYVDTVDGREEWNKANPGKEPPC